MRKRKIKKGLLCAGIAACLLCGGFPLKIEQVKAERLSTELKTETQRSATHSVTFIVNGEVYALIEWIPDNTALKEAMIEDVSLSGYDFLGWTYGDGQIFTKDTPVTDDLTVTAILRERPYRQDELAAYISLQNLDFGAQASLTHSDEEAGNYPIDGKNDTTSMTYKFEYVDKGDGALYFSIRDVFGGNGERGYAFIFDGKIVYTPVGEVVLNEESKYVVEVGAIDARSGGKTYIFVKVNGEIKLDGRVTTKLNTGSVLTFGGESGATSAFMQVNAYLVGGNHYETLNEAVKNAGDNEICLARDVETVSLTQGAATLNLNGNGIKDIRIDGGTLTLYGGSVTGDITLLGGTLIIKGGSFFEDVSPYLADGYHCIPSGEEYLVGAHERTALQGYAPTCEESGLTNGEKCAVCGEILISQQPIEALGHQAQILQAIPATCQTQGKTEGSQCAVCGKILKEQESIPNAAHDFAEGICRYCGKAENEDSVGEASSNGDSSSSHVDTSTQSATDSAVETSSQIETTSETISESTSETQEKGCAGSVGLSFGAWMLIIVPLMYFRKKDRQ